MLNMSDCNFVLSPLNFKFERFKHISILILDTAATIAEWSEYVSKLSADKRNISLRFVLPILVTKEATVIESHSMGIPVSHHFAHDEIRLIRHLLRQKIDYLEKSLNHVTDESKKFLLSIMPKLNWKDQVVLTGEDMSSFMNPGKFNKDILNLGDNITLVKFWEYLRGPTEQSIFLNIESDIYKLQKSDLNEDQLRKILLFVIFYENYQSHTLDLIRTEFMINFYEDIFQLAPFPIAVELAGRDLVWQNKVFSNLKLLPRLFKKIEDGEKVHTRHGFFIVYKKQFQVFNSHYQLIYLAQQSEKISSTSEDLGIITSSLAHEMNNPLSAIKAAIEVILILEKNLKSKETLDQMLVSVNRCLQLVKIFLGFTKATFQKGSVVQSKSDDIPFRDCWDYALQLMRTRLISASMRLNAEWCVETSFSVLNSNIVTMMLYWMLSQIVNILERKLLISRNLSSDQKIIIHERRDEVTIEVGVSLREIATLLEQSLLMKHLLELEDLSFELKSDTEILLLKNKAKEAFD